MRKLSKTSRGNERIQLPQEWHKQTGIKNSCSGCVTSSLYMLALPVGIFYPVTFTSVFRNVFLCIVTLRVGIGLLFYSQTQGLSHCNFPASQFIFPASRSPSFNHVITFFFFFLWFEKSDIRVSQTRMNSTRIVKIKIPNSFSYKIWKLDRK